MKWALGFLFFGFNLLSWAQTPSEILTLHQTAIQNIESISFQSKQKILPLGLADTSFFSAQFRLEKAPTDTNFSYSFHLFDIKSEKEYWYHQGTGYSLNPKTQKIFTYQNDETFPGAPFERVLMRYAFVNTFDSVWQDKIQIKPELATDNHWVFEYKIEQLTTLYYLNKSSHLFDKEVSIQTAGDLKSVQITEMKNVVINAPEVTAVFDMDSLANNYAVQTASVIKTPLLREQTPAPNFNLKGLNGFSAQLSDFEGKWLLLYFWYSSCVPCVKALPKIQQLQDTLANNNFVVLGMNHGDHSAESQRRIPQFLADRNIEFPTVFVSEETKKAYHINASPTFYLINPEGNIALAFVGYNQEKIGWMYQHVLGED